MSSQISHISTSELDHVYETPTDFAPQTPGKTIISKEVETMNMTKTERPLDTSQVGFEKAKVGGMRNTVALSYRALIAMLALAVFLLVLTSFITVIIVKHQKIDSHTSMDSKDTTETQNTTSSTSPPSLENCQGVLPSSDAPDGRRAVRLAGGAAALCDTATDGGGWLVFQRRAVGDVDFYRGWQAYKHGFGSPGQGDFWWGLEKLHGLTAARRYELRVDLAVDGVQYYQLYRDFMVWGEDRNYQIRVREPSGNAGDSMIVAHDGRPFTTKDRDNDSNNQNCAIERHGAWWYSSCHDSNLNGEWGSTAYGRGLNWYTKTEYDKSATFTEMKIRPLI